jgi:hypothetical protein
MADEPSFLDIEVAAPEPSWLEIETIEAPKSALPYDSLRFQCMRGSGRVWACDGRYVAYRPFNHVLDKHANPVFQERVERFQREGHFEHVGTFDEVMIFKLKPESPWYATEDKAYVAGKSLWGDINHAIKLACARDWKDYTDLLEAMASGMLAGRDPTFARHQWEDALKQVAIGIYQKGGPLAVEVAAGVENVRLSRGTSRGPKLVLSSDVANAKNVVYEK